VTEVAQTVADGKTLRGSLELKDLSSLLGGAPGEQTAGMAVVLDVSPTLAVRVARVREVVDVAPSPFFGLPPGLSEALGFVSRGAVLYGNELFLELIPEALSRNVQARAAAPPRPVIMLDQTPERALVFESQGMLWGLPLAFVSQVVPRTQAWCPLPYPHGAIMGIFPHDQALWSVLSVPALIGGAPVPEDLFLLAELAGELVGLSASRVVGVLAGFTPTGVSGEFRVSGVGGPILFLDYQSMFS
jgi:chemotaxis signal transduction protein